MGQQQLLLLVFGVIIVGLAILAGLQAIQEGIRKSEADRLVDRSLAIASAAVSWKTRNDPFAGGNQSYEKLGTNGLDRLAMEDASLVGEFMITSATEGTLEITGVSLNYPEIGVRTYIEDYTIVSTDIRYDGSISLDE